jgi:RNA polymerase sigma-70 factor (ECF subfamily)
VPVPTDDFADFYEASYQRVVALAAAIVGDRHQAEDIAQEAFSRALTRWSRIARYDLPEASVRRVALRLTVDATRRMRRARVMSTLLAVGQRGAAGDRYDRAT